jgi:uncharacterized protein (DUF427 family)
MNVQPGVLDPPQEHLDVIFLNATTSNHTTLQARSKRLSEDAVRLMGQLVESDNEGQVVEGNYYFPPQSIKREPLQVSVTHTTCSWEREASYYDIVADGKVNKDAAWYYPSPKEAAKHIAGYVAFWKGVQAYDR